MRMRKVSLIPLKRNLKEVEIKIGETFIFLALSFGLPFSQTDLFETENLRAEKERAPNT